MKLKLYLAGITVFVIALLFLAFPDTLLYTLLEDPYLPIGTIYTWIGFIAFTSFFCFLYLSLQRTNYRLSKIFKSLFQSLRVLSFLWIFIGFFFSNNWSMSFSGSISEFRGSAEASVYYWGFNYFMLGAPVLLFLIFIILRFFKKL